MSFRTATLAGLVAGLAAAVSLPPAAMAVNFGALQSIANSPGGLTFERARSNIPGLQRVTFNHADANGDGVITGAEFPAFQAMVQTRMSNR